MFHLLRGPEHEHQRSFWLLLFSGLSTATVFLFRKHLPYLSLRLIGGHNDVLDNFGIMAAEWDALLSARWNEIFDASYMFPYPHALAMGDSLLPLTLIGLPFAALGEEVLAYNFALLSTYVLCGIFCAAFCLRLTGNRWAAVVGAFAFAFFPLRLTNVIHINNLALMGIPLASWGFLAWCEDVRFRWMLLTIAGAYLQFLSSAQMAMHLALFTGLWAFGIWASKRFQVRKNHVLQLTLGGVILTLLLLPWALFYGEALDFVGARRSLDMMYGYRVHLSDYWQGKLHPGVVVLLLGGLGLLCLPPSVARSPSAAHRRHYVVFIALLIIGVVLSLGPMRRGPEGFEPLPYFALLKALPWYWAVRVPSRMHRVLMLYTTGIASLGFVALLQVVIPAIRVRLARPRKNNAASATHGKALATVGAILLVLLSNPKPPGHGTQLPRPPYAEALAALPEEAVVFPYPFFLNWPRRPPLDIVAIRSSTTLVGGYAASISDLFWQLQRRSGTFPAPSALAAIRAAGADHVLIQRAHLGKKQSARVEQMLDNAGWRVLYEDSKHWLIHIGPSKIQYYSLSNALAGQEVLLVRGPSKVPPDQELTFALWPRIEHTALDMRSSYEVQALLISENGKQRTTKLRAQSPRIVEPQGKPYRLRFKSPTRPGPYTVRIQRAQTTALSWSFVVDSSLSIGRLGSPKLWAESISYPSTIVRGRHFPLRLGLKNEAPRYWKAASSELLPSHAGALALSSHYRGPQNHRKATKPDWGYSVLPHDLAPGDTVSTLLFPQAPQRAGIYALDLWMLPYHLDRPKASNRNLSIDSLSID